MQAWLESVAPGYGPALIWTLAALIGLLILLIAIRIVRGLTFGTFVAGGRNRKTRLAVMDATAVDSHRRLVLVRRDDVEHLILIGGPSDVVVEQNIRMVPAGRRNGPVEEAPVRPTTAAPMAPMAQATPPAPQPAPVAAPRPVREPVPAPIAPVVPAPPPSAPAVAAPAAPAAPRAAFQQAPAPAPSVSVAPPPRPATMPSVTAPAVAANPAPSYTSPAAPRVEPRFGTTAAPQEPAPRHVVSTTPPQVASVQPPRPAAAPAPNDMPDLDDDLLEELEVSLEREHATATTPPSRTTAETDRALDEEMTRLLSDLGGPKRH